MAQCKWHGLLFGAQLAIGDWHVAHASVRGAMRNMRATCAATLPAAPPQHLKFVKFDLCWFVWLVQVAWLVVWETICHWVHSRPGPKEELMPLQRRTIKKINPKKVRSDI